MTYKPHKFLENTPNNGTVTLPRNLVDDIILELSMCHGVYCTDRTKEIVELDDDLWWKIDNSPLITQINKYIK